MSRIVVIVVLASVVLAGCAHGPHGPFGQQQAGADDCSVSAAPVIDAVGGLAAAFIGIPRQFVSAASTIYEMHRAARCNAVAEAASMHAPHARSMHAPHAPPHAPSMPAQQEPHAPMHVPAAHEAEALTVSTTAEPQGAYGSVEALMRR